MADDATTAKPPPATNTKPAPIDRAFRPCERRVNERKPVRLTVTVHEVDNFGLVGPGVECRAFDLSRCGLGLHSRRMYASGITVAVVLPTAKAGEKPRVVFGEVRYSRYSESATAHHTGLRMVAGPTSAGVARWLASLVAR